MMKAARAALAFAIMFSARDVAADPPDSGVRWTFQTREPGSGWTPVLRSPSGGTLRFAASSWVCTYSAISRAVGPQTEKIDVWCIRGEAAAGMAVTCLADSRDAKTGNLILSSTTKKGSAEAALLLFCEYS